MTYNLPLLRKERDWVAEQNALPYSESELYMHAWMLDTKIQIEDVGKTCGTTYCIAGHMAFTTPGVEWYDKAVSEQIVADGKIRSIEDWAAEQLGLSEDEAGYLFHCDDHEALDALNELITAAEAEERDQVA